MIIFKTERLVLRKFVTNDAPFIVTLLNTPTWLQYIGDRQVRNLKDARKYLMNGPIKSYTDNGFGLSLVMLKENKVPIGMCGLIRRETLEHVDIGFALLPEYAGQGYAYEIASATIHHGKYVLGLPKIIAITSSDNNRSIKLLNKLGMQFEKMIQLTEEDDALMLLS